VVKGENYSKIYPYGSNIKTINDYNAVDYFAQITSSYPLTSSISRNIIISGANGPVITGGISYQITVDKVKSLYNNYNAYATFSKYFDFNSYLMKDGGKPPNTKLVNPAGDPNGLKNTVLTGALLISPYINVIEIPRLFRGKRLKRGSVKLKFYYTGSLLAEARDLHENGEIVEVTGTLTGNTIGTVMYKEGVILITASYALHALKDGYLSPESGTYASPKEVGFSSTWVDVSRWVHFGASKSYITSAVDILGSSSYAPCSSSYVLEFEGTHVVPTLLITPQAQKNDLNWSNNPTFIEKSGSFVDKNYADIYVLNSSSTGYVEKDKVTIKNTISSSFCDHSESYKPQTYISKIGVYDDDDDLIAIAKLSNPVRKTNEQDYTFKLKLDL
jgi:hypothetical protein